MYILQCTNADISVMSTVFNHGYSITDFNKFSISHHVHTIPEQFGAFRATRQSTEVISRACSFPALKNIISCNKE